MYHIVRLRTHFLFRIIYLLMWVHSVFGHLIILIRTLVSQPIRPNITMLNSNEELSCIYAVVYQSTRHMSAQFYLFLYIKAL